MRIIILAKDGESEVNLMAAARAAHAAIRYGIEGKEPGYVMGVGFGDETFGVVRRKSAISVYPPDRKEGEK